jgi:guanine nucleotide-binding protein subunit alpha
MGLCASSDTKGAPVDQQAKAASKAIENKMAAEHQEEKQVNKLLLLGAGESGKSTLFKQMIRYVKSRPSGDRPCTH